MAASAGLQRLLAEDKRHPGAQDKVADVSSSLRLSLSHSRFRLPIGGGRAS